MRASAVIPVREFASTKLRLKGILSDTERAALTAQMLAKVLKSLEASHIDSIIAVASNPNEVSSHLPTNSKLSVVRESRHHGGVNRAFSDGIRIAKITNSNKILLLPSDLPMINTTSIDRALELLEHHDLIICPSIKKDGTNLLGIDTSKEFELHYDDDSYFKHLNEARSYGLDYASFECQEFTQDLDDPEDLEKVIQIYGASGFEDLLMRISSRSYV